MAENEREITTVFKADISNFTAATQQLNRDVALINAEFKNATASMSKWSDNTDGLKAKLTQLTGTLDIEKKRLAQLQAQYDKLKAAGKENTTEAQKLNIAINNQSAKVKATQREINYYTESLNQLEKAGVKTKQELDALTNSTEKQGTKVKSVAATMAKTFVTSVAAIGAAAVAAGAKIYSMANQVATAGDEIDKESQKLGINAESYQELSYAMTRCGSSISDLTKGIRTITSELADTENGVEGAGKAFTELGVDLKNTDGTIKTTEQVLLESIDALASMENETQRNAIAQDIFGRSAAELKPLLNSGAEGINALMQEAKAYNMVMSDEGVKASAAFKDSLTKLNGTLNGLKNTMLGSLLPSITSILDGLTDLVAGVNGAGAKIKNGVTNVITELTKFLPAVTDLITNIANAILESAPSIIQALADGILKAIPQLVPVLLDVGTNILNTLMGLIPQVLNLVIDLVGQVLNTLASILPSILPLIVKTVLDCAEAILDNLDVIIDAGIALILALTDGLIKAIPVLIDKMPVLIDKVVDAIINNLPKIMAAGVELILKLVQGIIMAVPQLIAQTPIIIRDIIKGLLEGIPQLMAAGAELLESLFKGLLDPKIIWENIKKLGGSIISGFKNFFGIKGGSSNLSLPVNSMPALAAGGIVNTPTLAMVGEAGKEAIMPLENNTQWLDVLADKLTIKLKSNNTSNVTNNFNYTFEKMETTKLALHKATLETKRVLIGG